MVDLLLVLPRWAWATFLLTLVWEV